MTSVFAYRAPTDEDKVHLAALQDGFLRLEAAIIAYWDNPDAPLSRAAHDVCRLLEDHVPKSHEQEVAFARWTAAGEAVVKALQPWTDGASERTHAMDLLRECRMWANAGIVLVRTEPTDAT